MSFTQWTRRFHLSFIYFIPSFPGKSLACRLKETIKTGTSAYKWDELNRLNPKMKYLPAEHITEMCLCIYVWRGLYTAQVNGNINLWRFLLFKSFTNCYTFIDAIRCPIAQDISCSHGDVEVNSANRTTTTTTIYYCILTWKHIWFDGVISPSPCMRLNL